MDTTDLLDSADATRPDPHVTRGRRPWLVATVAAVAAVSAAGAVAVPRLISTGTGSDGPLPVPQIGVPFEGADTAAAASGSRAAKGGRTAAAPFRLVGTLPGGPDHAPVQRLDAAPVSHDRVAALARALGLKAEPQRHGADWWVRSGGAQLTVYAGPGQPWVYVRADAAGCPPLPLDGYTGPSSTVGCAMAGPVTTAATAIAPRPGGPMAYKPPRPLPADRLRAEAGPVLDATGLSFSSLWVSYDAVLADPLVGSRPTSGATTAVTADQAGISTATGWLLGGHVGTDYPLRSARSLFDTMQAEPQIRPMMACAPIPKGAVNACELPPLQQDITGATLGLTMAWEKDIPVLVPAWLFDIGPGTNNGDPGQVVRVAVATKYLAAAEPAGQGSVASSGPGTSGPDTPVPGTSVPEGPSGSGSAS